MIEPWVAHELRQIEQNLCVDDRHFANGFRHGKPCPPREYRHRRWRRLTAVATLVLVIGLPVIALLGVVAAVTGVVVGIVVAVLPRLVREPRQLRDWGRQLRDWTRGRFTSPRGW